jgi:hypothetical protein
MTTTTISTSATTRDGYLYLGDTTDAGTALANGLTLIIAEDGSCAVHLIDKGRTRDVMATVEGDASVSDFLTRLTPAMETVEADHRARLNW